MGPYVIDQKKRQEYFLFLIFFIVISFALGYFFGYQSGQSKADVTHLKSDRSGYNEKTLETIPAQDINNTAPIIKSGTKTDPVPAKKSSTKKKTTDTKKKNDTKKTKTKSKAVASKPKPKPKPKPKSKPKPKAKEKPKKQVVQKTSSPKKVTKQASSVNKVTARVSETVKKNPTVKTISQALPAGKSTDSLNNTSAGLDSKKAAMTKARHEGDAANNAQKKNDQADASTVANATPKPYSVQVGMFSSKPNAEKYIENLKGSGFTVYLGSFISSSGSEKYNVRLGPYELRSQAKEKMALYKENYTTPAYIVIKK